jgi:N-acetylglucosamine malate deacetylase 1
MANLNPYQRYVADFARLVAEAKSFPLGKFEPAPRPETRSDAPTALFFAPHPDDECVGGGLALRLLREAGMRVINVGVTLGSKKERQPGRFQELQGACGYLGFGLELPAPSGLEQVNFKARGQDPARWAGGVQAIAKLILAHRPRVILCPHEHDWNSTHIGTHFLVMDALARMPADYEGYVVETEFWGQMADPNLMVEISVEILADLITATTFHVGEVARNPYHVLLPGWMLDNVRRGSELVGGQGGQAPDFTFSAIYRLRKWSQGRLARCFEGGKQVARYASLQALFP